MLFQMAPKKLSGKIRRMVDDGFKLQSTFSIKIQRIDPLEKFLLNQPSKTVLRRKSELSSRNRNDFVQPKAILKNIKDKPMCVSGRRRSVGYINVPSNQNYEDNLVEIDSTSPNVASNQNYEDILVEIDSTSPNSSTQVTVSSQENIINDVTRGNSIPEATSGEIEIDLITFSPEIEHSQYSEVIITTIKSPVKQNDMGIAQIGDDFFGFLSNDETESNVIDGNHRNELNYLQQPSTSARCFLFEDLEQSIQCPESPQIVLNRSTHKTYYGPASYDENRALRNYMDLMTQEERFLHGDVAPANIARRPIPDLIPIQREADDLSIELAMEAETHFGQLYFSESD